LPLQRSLNSSDVHLPGARPVLERHGSDHAGALPGYRAAHLIADSSVRDPVSGHAAPGDQQGLDVLRNEDPVARLKVAAGRGQDQDAIAVDELGEDADWA